MSMQGILATIERILAPRRISHCLKRPISHKADGYPRDFTFLPDFFSISEQRVLLSAALEKLDQNEPLSFRRRRKGFQTSFGASSPGIQDLFLPNEYYRFEQGHFDGVIKNYREMHVSAWPEEPALQRILDRLRSVHPPQLTQTHILHLASDGEIFPHVDNVGASGAWILGVSLGDTRVLRLECIADPTDIFEILLPSGSIYIQSDTIRYQYKHSVLGRTQYNGKMYGGDQRLSVMIRDQQITNDGIQE